MTKKKRPPGVPAGNTKASSAGSALATYRWSMTPASVKAKTMADLREKKLQKSIKATGQAKFQQDEKARRDSYARMEATAKANKDRKDLEKGRAEAAATKKAERELEKMSSSRRPPKKSVVAGAAAGLFSNPRSYPQRRRKKR